MSEVWLKMMFLHFYSILKNMNQEARDHPKLGAWRKLLVNSKNVGEDALKFRWKMCIIRIGAECADGDLFSWLK